MKTTDVLLVDDNPADTDLTSEILAKHRPPCHVHAVSSVDEALKYVISMGVVPPDLPGARQQ